MSRFSFFQKGVRTQTSGFTHISPELEHVLSTSSRPSTSHVIFNAGTRLRRWSGSLLSDSIHLQLLGCVSSLPATRP